MTAPRQILPHATYLVTRRCAQRQFLLRPSESTNAIVLYVLAVAARRYGILIHAFCALSNHIHLVVTDPGSRLPAFQQYVDALVARAVNASLGRWESFWAPSSYSAVRLVSPADVLDKTAYVLANPVAAGLVRTASEWPGLWSDPSMLGSGKIVVRRPKHFFSANGSMPESVELALVAPPGFDSADQFREQLVDALAAREREAVRAQEVKGLGFMGPRKVLAQRPNGRPAPGEPRRALNPRIASRDKWRRIEALGRLLEFLQDYRTALRAWKNGMRAVVFPAGTYGMRIGHDVVCAAAP
ncbi:conserved hypothetical protein [Anaeromyxobacter dehalogenans 2CP-1]|uniref:Transposase IS200-like domain-containing protein n=1 Tax=Anaeromyxobacter dehalogenans (strain ATCC BAA-258 / DSM 21875 / 2CP-1) TaxID=455488 RepID=B8J9R2_ANAD2|nr:hypothetical protein [Anaeromyxobacter dehalogenans]ACL67450.1 conserved hypothetical protein [Anaeromyxobacter dehalogenans 2CP-1]